MKKTLRHTALVTLIATTLTGALLPSNALAFKGAARPAASFGSGNRGPNSPTYGGVQRYVPPSNNHSSVSPGPNNDNSHNTPSPNASRPQGLLGDWFGRVQLRDGMMNIGVRLQEDGVFKCRFSSDNGQPSGFDGQWYVSGSELVFAPEDGSEPMVMPLQIDSRDQFRVRFIPNGPLVEMKRMENNNESQTENRPEQYSRQTQPRGYTTPHTQQTTPTPRGRYNNQRGPANNANQIVGSWVGQANVQHVTIQTQVMFNADGTMHFQAFVNAAGQGTTNMQIAGRWRLEGNRVIVDVQDEVDELVIQNGALMLNIEDYGITIPLHRVN